MPLKYKNSTTYEQGHQELRELNDKTKAVERQCRDILEKGGRKLRELNEPQEQLEKYSGTQIPDNDCKKQLVEPQKQTKERS